MLTNFGQSAQFLANVKEKREEEANKKKGFLGQLGESLLDVGVRAAVGEVVEGTIGAYKENQQQKQADFENSSFAVEAKRNNKDIRRFIESYREAEVRAKNNGTNFDEEFAKSDLIKNRALNELKRKKFYKESRAGTITDEQLFDYAQPLALAEVKRNREVFDDIYNKAKNVRTEEEFNRFIKENSGVAKTVFGGIGNKIRTTFQGKSLGDIAAEKINNDPRYGNTLGAQEVLDDYIINRNEGQFINDLNNLKLSEMPDATNVRRERDIEYKTTGDGRIIAVEKVKIINERLNTVNTYSKVLDQDFANTANLALMTNPNDALNKMTPDAKTNFVKELNRRMEALFPTGVELPDGSRAPYNHLDYKRFNTPEGGIANRVSIDLLLEMTGELSNFVSQSEAEARGIQNLLTQKNELGNMANTIVAAYGNNVIESPDGKTFKVRLPSGQIVDPNDSKFKDDPRVSEIVKTYKEAKEEISAVVTYAAKTNKIKQGVEAGLIQTRIVPKEFLVQGEKVFINGIEPLPLEINIQKPYFERKIQGSKVLGTEDQKIKEFNFLPGVPPERKKLNEKKFNDFMAYKNVYRFDTPSKEKLRSRYGLGK